MLRPTFPTEPHGRRNTGRQTREHGHLGHARAPRRYMTVAAP
jgi:hypothetical protein